MAFTDSQTRKLRAKLNAKYVRTRLRNGATLSYIEGWHVIAEANRIFGFDGWDRETVTAQCVWSDMKRDACRCSYTAKVRIKVRAGETVVIREGNGSGEGRGSTPAEAHDIALKAAETDGTKRALTTFGNAFGLALYDKNMAGVTKARPAAAETNKPLLQLKSATGIPGPTFSGPDTFVEGLTKAIGHVPTIKELFELWEHNVDTVRLIRKLPSPKAVLGEKLVGHLKARAIALGDLHAPAENGKGNGQAKIDKSLLALPEPRRVRSKEHLAFVARQPCLVCDRTPAQAHHLRFAQARAMARKVSDEYVVPLCNIHHFELHQTGDERAWWKDKKIDPMAVARKLWAERRDGKVEKVADVSAENLSAHTQSKMQSG